MITTPWKIRPPNIQPHGYPVLHPRLFLLVSLPRRIQFGLEIPYGRVLSSEK
jgi:hypothetical protein